MGFENFNLDTLENAVHDRSNGRKATNLAFDVRTGKFTTFRNGQSIPQTSVVSNEMTDEGFA